jgi:hypothetical protein
MGEAKRRGHLGAEGTAGGPTRSLVRQTAPFKIENPLVIMFADKGGDVQCHIYPSERCPTHEEYRLLIADLVRHVARAFDVGEEDVWEWVDKERRHPTTAITNPS